MRSISDALALSTTWAKSLTGPVSSGSGGSAANRVRLKPDTTPDRTRPANTAAHTVRHAERRTPDAARLASIPAIDVRHELLDRIQVRREQTFGISRRQVVAAGQRDDVRDGPARDAKRPFRVTSGGTVFGPLPFEPGDASQQRGKGRLRLDDEIGQRVGAAMGLEVRLPQMQQVAARLYFARAADVGWVEPRGGKRIRARDDDVIGEDRTELQRKGVERSIELVCGDEQRRGQPVRVPRGDAPRARVQVFAGHALDHRHRPRRCLGVAVRAGLRVLAGWAAVHDQRLQSRAEDLAQLAVDEMRRVRNGHLAIVRSFWLSAFSYQLEGPNRPDS